MGKSTISVGHHFKFAKSSSKPGRTNPGQSPWNPRISTFRGPGGLVFLHPQHFRSLCFHRKVLVDHPDSTWPKRRLGAAIINHLEKSWSESHLGWYLMFQTTNHFLDVLTPILPYSTMLCRDEAHLWAVVFTRVLGFRPTASGSKTRHHWSEDQWPEWFCGSSLNAFGVVILSQP